MIYLKNIKLGALLGIFFSLISFIICLVYVIVSNLPASLLSIIIIYAISQIFVFSSVVFLYIKPSISPKLVFKIGIMALFAILAPGLIILIAYFKQKKQKDNINLTLN